MVYDVALCTRYLLMHTVPCIIIDTVYVDSRKLRVSIYILCNTQITIRLLCAACINRMYVVLHGLYQARILRIYIYWYYVIFNVTQLYYTYNTEVVSALFLLVKAY